MSNIQDLLGFITKDERTNEQHDAAARAEGRMVQRFALPIPTLAKGDSIRLFDSWKHPKVVKDVGFVFPRFHQITGSCLIANTYVSTTYGERKYIQDVVVGDLVTTHTGEIRKVTRLMSRQYTGKMVKLYLPNSSGSVEMTEDHKVPVVNKQGLEKYSWIPAADLKTGDVVYLQWYDGGNFTNFTIEQIESYEAKDLTVYDFEVEVDHSFIANGLVVHNCVGTGGGQALFTLSAVQRLLSSGATKAFLPWWPYDYGRSRALAGMNGRGEGSMGSAFADAVVKNGVIDATTAGLPAFTNDDGLTLTSSLEMQWSDGNSSTVTKWNDAARVHLVGSAAPCRTTDDIKAMIANGYPVTFACDNYIGHASVQGTGSDACVVGYWDGNGGHQQSIHAVWEHPTLGTLFWAQNNWPGSFYPSDPAGGPVCGCWVTEAHVAAALRLNSEVYGLSHLDWFPAQPDVLDKILFKVGGV